MFTQVDGKGNTLKHRFLPWTIKRIKMGNDNTFVHMLKLFLGMVHKSEHTILTTNGEGEHGAATARLKLEPGGGSPNKYELGKPQAHGSGKVRDGRKRGEVKTIRAKKPPLRRCTRNSRQGVQTRAEHTRLRHKDRAVKRDEIRIFTSGRSVDFSTIHRPA